MAQATYDDSTRARIARTLESQRAASAATQARAAANLPGATPRAGVSVTDLGSAPTTISRADVQNRAVQLAQQNPAGNVVGGDVPAAARRAVPSVSEIDPATLSASERAGFARQGYNFAAEPAAAAPARAGSFAVDAERAAGTLARTAPARNLLTGAAGVAARGAGGLGVLADAYDATRAASAGDYGGAAKSTGLGVLDTAALAAPSPITAGAALTGHVADYAFGDNGPLAAIPRYIAGKINEYNGVQTPEQIYADTQAMRADRAARGLPLAPERQPNIVVRPPISTGVEFGAETAGAPVTGLSPSIAALPTARSDSGRDLGYGRVVNGVRTFSDGSGGPNAVPRTMTQAQIDALGSESRLSRADSGIGGGIVSEAAGGRTVELGQGPGRGGGGFTAEDRQAQLDAIQRRGDQAEFDRLMKKSQVELSRGNRRTAQILAGLAEQYKGKQEVPSERAVNIAKAGELNAIAAETQSSAARRNSITDLIQQAGATTDANKRESLYDTILASEGKNNDRVITVKVPDPSGAVDALGNPLMRERIFDTRLRKYIDQ